MVKTNQELWGTPFPLYAEWDAGVVLRAVGGGRVSVRRVPDFFEVFFHTFSDDMDIVFYRFPPTDDGERAAKQTALRLLRALRRG